MKKSSIKSKPSTQTLIKGLTFIEVLVALGIGLTIMTLAFSITMANRRLLNQDQARTSINQNARSAIDIIGTDIRIAGERLSPRGNINIPAIEVNNTANGVELVLRRIVNGAILPLCEASLVGAEAKVSMGLSASTTQVDLNVYPTCRVVDNDSDNIPDNLESWREYREAQEGDVTRAYIHKPQSNNDPLVGEFFNYNSESQDTRDGAQRFNIMRQGGTWVNTYDLDDNPSIILLEEKRYGLNNGVLEVVVNGDTGNPQRVVDNVEGFQVRALMKDGTTQTTLNLRPHQWDTLSAIEVSITTNAEANNQEVERTLTSRFFPRNALSN